jgi:5-methylcytosine-specific restriction endonuclease McrA
MPAKFMVWWFSIPTQDFKALTVSVGAFVMPGESGVDMGKSAGRSGGRWRALHKAQRARRLPCYLCGLPINYEARDANADDAFSVDHIKPWRNFPELREDPANLASAHQLCNKQKSSRPLRPGLGIRSRDW